MLAPGCNKQACCSLRIIPTIQQYRPAYNQFGERIQSIPCLNTPHRYTSHELSAPVVMLLLQSIHSAVDKSGNYVGVSADKCITTELYSADKVCRNIAVSCFSRYLECSEGRSKTCALLCNRSKATYCRVTTT
jgi:hypothetical protein